MKTMLTNESIRCPWVMLILEDGQKYGNTDIRNAREMASQKRLDLVLVSQGNNGDPPVCKLMDYGKMKYELAKREKHSKHAPTVKEMRIRMNTASHDLEIKNNKVKSFLQKHHPVVYSMILKGREKSLREEAIRRFQENIKDFVEVATWDKLNVSSDIISVMLKAKNEQSHS